MGTYNGADVAIKTYTLDNSQNQFVNEVKIFKYYNLLFWLNVLRECSFRNIVQFFGWSIYKEQNIIVMEHCTSGNLSEYISNYDINLKIWIQM